MIRMPWQKWVKPPPPDPKSLRDAVRARREAERRRWQTDEALRRRQAIVVHNHIANDIRRAMGRKA